MAWIYIGIVLVSMTAAKLLVRKTLQNVGSYAFSLFTQLVSVVVLLPFMFSAEIPKFSEMGRMEYIGLIIAGVLWTFVALIANKATQLTDVSLREPIVQVRTLFGFLIGVLLFAEGTTMMQIAGVAVLFVACLVTAYRPNMKGYGFKEEGVLLVVASAFLYAIVAAFDKFNAGLFPTLYYTFILYAIPGALMLLYLPWGYKEFRTFSPKTLFTGTLASILQCIGFYFTIKVFVELPFTTAYPMLQLPTILVSVLGMVIFKESTNRTGRIIGAILSVVGVLLIRL